MPLHGLSKVGWWQYAKPTWNPTIGPVRIPSLFRLLSRLLLSDWKNLVIYQFFQRVGGNVVSASSRLGKPGYRCSLTRAGALVLVPGMRYQARVGGNYVEGIRPPLMVWPYISHIVLGGIEVYTTVVCVAPMLSVGWKGYRRDAR